MTNTENTQTMPTMIRVHSFNDEVCDRPETVQGDPENLCGHGFNAHYEWA